MKWKSKSVSDRGLWIDYYSEDGRLLIAQGYDEFERREGRPYGLFDISDDRHWKVLGFFRSLDEAKKAAEPVEAPQETAASL